LPDGRLRLCGGGGTVPQRGQFPVQFRHLPRERFLLFPAHAPELRVRFVHGLVAPPLPRFLFVRIAAEVESGELLLVRHGDSSFHVPDRLVDRGDQPVQPLALLDEHPAVQRQRFRPVERRIVQDPLDLVQRKIERPKEQNVLQLIQIPLRIQAVAAFRRPLRHEQSDLVVVMQRADADPRQFGHLFDLQHRVRPPFRPLR
jgi:hypothetical protein